MEIQFKPALKSRNLYYDLNKLFKTCLSFKASIAYWTINEQYFKTVLTDALKKKDSFVCFDLTKPTDLSAINSFWYEDATELYWYKYKMHDNADKRLLHSKVMLFDLPQNKAEIWVGSMNFTKAAIHGFNVESITVVTCLQTDPFYIEVMEFLNFLKVELCHKYDLSVPNNFNYYIALQSGSVSKAVLATLNFGQEEKVMSFIGENINKIKKDDIIVLYFKVQIAKNMFQLGGRVYLQIADYSLNHDYLFEAIVDGLAEHEENKTGIDFIGKKRFSYILEMCGSFLEESTDLNHKYQFETESWVTLKIVRPIETFEVRYKPNQEELNLWRTDSENSYARIMNIDEKVNINVKYAERDFKNVEIRKIRVFEELRYNYETMRNLSELIIQRNTERSTSNIPNLILDNDSKSMSLVTRLIKEKN